MNADQIKTIEDREVNRLIGAIKAYRMICDDHRLPQWQRESAAKAINELHGQCEGIQRRSARLQNRARAK